MYTEYTRKTPVKDTHFTRINETAQATAQNEAYEQTCCCRQPMNFLAAKSARCNETCLSYHSKIKPAVVGLLVDKLLNFDVRYTAIWLHSSIKRL
ncbi:hypothetical protein SAMN05660226_00233 [Parapedobacter luteus]|uniref:Uncharacterized protein n=1 Tax=Parapedobacter luteus TaxID=623280 RepID=A0A1T4ZWP8_9SPHI|nr:hypothetical protein SAMN05660226_00233 [Parapedobacter luteus]